jgi:hypothetical protein
MLRDSGQNGMDFEGDSIMRDAAEGLVQEQRRSLRGRAARSGVTGEEGGSEMSVIAGVSASGKGVRIGGSVKIGTGPGGVQRKKKKGDMDSVSCASSPALREALADKYSQTKTFVLHVEVSVDSYAVMAVLAHSTLCASNHLSESTNYQRKKSGTARNVVMTM